MPLRRVASQPATLLAAIGLLLAIPTTAGLSQAPSDRRIAVTIDDLPIGGPLSFDVAAADSMTRRLLGVLRRHRIPAIGFVIEGKLADDRGRPDPQKVALLEQWLAAGMELGNHSYTHYDLHRTEIETYLRDILRGEAVTRRLLAARGQVPRFFRHPFLHTGRDSLTQRRVTDFLERHRYRVAPVTIDNYDYLFANAYDRAAARGDRNARDRIARAYLEYMQLVIEYYERQSVALFGREIPQTLLIHASPLNARTMGDLATWLEERGYGFVPLDEVLRDPAYGTLDGYTGPSGITWLHRWAISMGKRGSFFDGEPPVPEWIRAP